MVARDLSFKNHALRFRVNFEDKSWYNYYV